MRIKVLLFCLFLLIPLFLPAQTARIRNELLNAEELNMAGAAWLALEAADVRYPRAMASPEDPSYQAEAFGLAFRYAMAQGWLPPGAAPGDLIALDEASLLLMRAFELGGGFFYGLRGSPHYAYRELTYLNVIQGRTMPGMRVSGELMFFMLGRIMADESPAAHNPGSYDFGLLLDQNAGFIGQGEEVSFSYSGVLVPRYSTFFSDQGEFYVSAGLKLDRRYENWILQPELLRLEFSWGLANIRLRAGRMHYSDPLGYIANGLFDGGQFSFNTRAGIFSTGAWYTGLLSKSRANIAMTAGEQSSLHQDLDYGDFGNTYFAPRRMIVAQGWEHPALGEFVKLRASLMGQFDLEGTRLHSHYLTAKMTLPVDSIIFDLGGSVALIQEADEIGMAFAGEFATAWMLPTPFDSRLSFLGRFTNGVVQDSFIRSFMPITGDLHGNVLKAKLSGLSLVSLDYLARLRRDLSAGFTSTCFLRSDLGTYRAYPVSAAAERGHIMGTEFYGRLVWSPFSDIQLNLGTGVFLPSLGNTATGEDPRWIVELNMIVSFY